MDDPTQLRMLQTYYTAVNDLTHAADLLTDRMYKLEVPDRWSIKVSLADIEAKRVFVWAEINAFMADGTQFQPPSDREYAKIQATVKDLGDLLRTESQTDKLVSVLDVLIDAVRNFRKPPDAGTTYV